MPQPHVAPPTRDAGPPAPDRAGAGDGTERLLAQLSAFESSHGVPSSLGALLGAGRTSGVALAAVGGLVVLVIAITCLAAAGALL